MRSITERIVLYIQKIPIVSIFIGIMYYFLYSKNLLLTMIKIDGVLCALNLFITIFKRTINIENINSKAVLYKSSLLNRYILYILYYSIYCVINSIFWINTNYVLHMITSLIVTPSVVDQIISTDIFQVIENGKIMIIKKIAAKNIVSLLNKISDDILQKKIEKIKYKTILNKIPSYEQLMEIFYKIIRNILIVLSASLIKKYARKMWYSVSKMIIYYITNNKMESFNINGARNNIISAIKNKNWNLLMEPKYIKSLVYIYSENDEYNNNVEKILIKLELLSAIAISLWTISSFFQSTLIIPLLSSVIFLHITKCRNNNEIYNNIKTIIITILTCILSIIIPHEYLLLSIFSQFGGYILFNIATYTLIKSVFKFLRKMIIKVYNNNASFTFQIINNILISNCCSLFLDTNKCYTILLMVGIHKMVTIKNLKANLINAILSLSLIFSKSFLHYINNIILMYIFVSLINNNDDRNIIMMILYIVTSLYTFIKNKIISIIYVKNDIKNEETKENSIIEINMEELENEFNNRQIINQSEIITKDSSIFELDTRDFINAISVNNTDDITEEFDIKTEYDKEIFEIVSFDDNGKISSSNKCEVKLFNTI